MINSQNEQIYVNNIQIACDHCRDWGATVVGVPCPKCGRSTHPWLGVNLPAGAAVAVSCGHALVFLINNQNKENQLIERDDYELEIKNSTGNSRTSLGE